MGNTEMEGDELSHMSRSQRNVPQSIRGRGGPKTRKERKQNVMMSEAETRTKDSLARLAIVDENVDPNNSHV